MDSEVNTWRQINHIPYNWAASPVLKGYLQVKIYTAFLYKLRLEISNVWWEDIFFIEEFKLGRIIEFDYYFAISNRITDLGNAYW